MYKQFLFSTLIFGILAVNLPLSAVKAQPVRKIKRDYQRTIEVTDIKQLNNAISSAKPGDTIVMADGNWNDVDINFNSNATDKAPVTLKAKTPGKVVLTGSSKLTFNKPHLIVDGLFFTNGNVKGSTVIEFKSDYCRLTNTTIVNYNPPKKETGYYWVFFSGNYNRVDHCFFKGKNNMQPLIGNNQDNSRHNSVSFCHFKDIPFTPDNGREIFRIWGYGRSEETGDDGAYFTIENNLFERAHGEGTEIISLKSNRNIVRYNTITGTKGGIVGRSGNFNTIEGNFIFGNNEESSTGIRVAGQGHRVVNNYISDVSGDGLILISGEYIDTFLTPDYKPIFREGTPLGRVPRYGHVKNGLFANNTFVNVGGIGINIGASYKPELGGEQRILIPENNRIVNNLVYKVEGGGILTAIQIKTPPLDIFTFKPNMFRANIYYGSKTNDSNEGIINADPLLSFKGVFYRPSKKSPVINKGIQTDTKDDIDGQERKGKMDIGADEFSQMKITRKPLTADDVGARWIIKLRKAGNKNF
jgi:poly(beta-D-mannuronate) lyase